VVFGENGMARSTNSRDAIFFAELAGRGFRKYNKALYQTQLLQNYIISIKINGH